MALSIVILAAGKGSRMHSKYPKALQKLAGKTLIQHVLDTVFTLNAEQTIIIHGHLGEQVQTHLAKHNIIWVEQREQLGTGHAVQMALPHIPKENKVLILYGDVPLIASDTLMHLVSVTSETTLGILTATMENPHGLGRIIRNRFQEIEKIVEDKDASPVEKQIHEVNTGIYCVSAAHLHAWLPKLKNDNMQKEYYLTDCISMAKMENININAAQPIELHEIFGVNSKSELAALENIWHHVQAKKHMRNGVSIANPDLISFRGNIKIGQDTQIDINVIFEGDVVIGEDCFIGAGCILKNVRLGNHAHLKPYTIVSDSIIDDHANLGPFTHIRPGSHIDHHAHVGNFVELKKTHLGSYSKTNHLSYLGDANIGTHCNIGAGTITCNYDGTHKHQTSLQDHVFVGSNTSLVAPVTLESNAFIGAGSVITKNVSQKTLAISRSKQIHIENWQPKQSKPIKQ